MFPAPFRAPLAAPFGGATVAAATNWWDAIPDVVAAWQPKGAASLAASYVNLKSPGTHNAVPVVAPAFDTSTGWSWNGSTTYATTDITPGDGWSVFARISDVGTADGYYLFGSVGSGFVKRFTISLNQGAANTLEFQHQSFASTSPKFTGSNVGFAGQQGYVDGVARGAAIGTNSGTYGAFYIGACNFVGIGVINFSQYKCQALIISSSTPTAPQITALYTAMAAL